MSELSPADRVAVRPFEPTVYLGGGKVRLVSLGVEFVEDHVRVSALNGADIFEFTPCVV